MWPGRGGQPGAQFSQVPEEFVSLHIEQVAFPWDSLAEWSYPV